MIGWIAVYRCIVDHWIWNTSSKRFQRWIDLLFLASWKDRETGFGQTIIHLNRGQLVTSTRQLMRRWGTNNTTVDTTLKLFEENGMISCDKTRKRTIITIINYNKYQRFATLAQSLAEEQDLLWNSDAANADSESEMMSQNPSLQRHFRVQNQVPIEQDNNIIIKQQSVVDESRAKQFLNEFLNQAKLKKGCKTLGIQEQQYIDLVKEVVDEWLFTEEPNWSYRHLLNHMRRKIKAQNTNTEDNGKSTTGSITKSRENESESPFSRATIYRATTDS